MMEQIVRGSLLPYLQYSERDYDPQRGWIYRYYFRGASQLLMESVQADFVRNGIACRLRYEQGETGTLEVEDSTQQMTLDVWEIVGNEEARDGFSHPSMVAIFPAQIGLFREFLADNKETSDLEAALEAAGRIPLDVDIGGLFYDLSLRGSGQYRHQQYVLRHTTNAPNRWASNISDFGVDQIYTPAQLLSEAQDSSLWVNPLPGRLAFKIANIPSPDPQDNYLWGWLKGASTEITAANNRIAIVQEYVLEQWSLAYYDSH